MSDALIPDATSNWRNSMRFLNACRSALGFVSLRSSDKTFPLLVAAAIVTQAAIGGMIHHKSLCFAGEERAAHDFSSLAKEAEFWDKWLEEHRGAAYFDPFFFSEELRGPVDKRLLEVAKHSDPFVLVVVSSVNSGRFLVISLAKSRGWQQINWKLGATTREPMKESSVKAPVVEEGVLKTLSTSPVFVEGKDPAFDCASVFVFIQYHGKKNRLAVYNPSRALRERAKQDEVAAALESLLENVGVLDSKRGHH